MKKSKYPISREFFPYSVFQPPMSRTALQYANRFLKVPGFLFRDPSLAVRRIKIRGKKNGEIELLLLTPEGIETPAPCLLHIHGGGFVFDASPSHYRHAMTYAKEARCIVAFVRYRLAPAYPFPYPQNDCYAAFRWIAAHARELGIDPRRIGTAGDSAGGMLAVTVCMMARDKDNPIRPVFQMLSYPYLDDRKNTASNLRFTDTPMWNSTLSYKVGEFINLHPEKTLQAYRSPAEADRFDDLPPAYIEVAEFDAFHDEGVQYGEKLAEEGIHVELHETKGTIHGFDTKVSAPTTRKMVAMRVEFMNRMFL